MEDKDILDFTTTREEWLNGIKTKSGSINSFKAYQSGIKKWDQFLESIHQTDKNVLSELKKKSNTPDTYLFLNKYITYLNKQHIKRSTIDLCFASLRSWCAINGILLFNEYIKRFVSLPKPHKEQKVSLTLEIIKTLIYTATSTKMKSILLVLLSSGIRISECLQIRVIDINHTTNPIQIKIRASTTKTREERTSYISNEAWNILQILLNNKEPTDYVFTEKFTENSVVSFEILFSRLRKQCGFLDKYDDERNYHVNIHAFRSYFHTQATKILGGDTSHALLGHHQYLDQYFRLSNDEKSEMYHELEPYLTISDEFKH